MQPPSPTKQILVVEDDFDIREALTQVLRDEGYHVIGAANGREAIDLLRTQKDASLILLDLMMPVMDGWQFRRAQQADPELARIPVVVLSADASVQQRASAIEAAGYLRKPIQLDTLLGTVARFCA